MRLSIHKIGNAEDAFSFYSKQEVSIEEPLTELLRNYFLSSFKSEEHYRFYHDASLSLHEVYTYVSAIFDDPAKLHEQSVLLARHLYDQSTHPRIKPGEFYVVYFEDGVYEGEQVEAIGLFKSENKDTFLDVHPQGEDIEVKTAQGININKLDKGCLVYNKHREEGYVLAVVDNTNKTEAQYWKDDFLHIMVRNDNYRQTHQVLNMTKQFVTKQFVSDFDVSKTDQIDLLNRSVGYFKNHETFDKKEFENEVLFHDEVINSFRKFDEGYRRDNDVELADSFDISGQAVKKQARVFKSVLKLDKNFHIYIHGNRELIEQGIDENGRKYYKIYYENES
ncbi:MAG: nucleoid-associated protein [Niabella sp.]